MEYPRFEIIFRVSSTPLIKNLVADFSPSSVNTLKLTSCHFSPQTSPNLERRDNPLSVKTIEFLTKQPVGANKLTCAFLKPLPLLRVARRHSCHDKSIRDP